MNHKCPYCNRKVKYTVRLLEHNHGEHICSHCEKPSNITQNKQIWKSLLISVLCAVVVMIFYLVFSDMIEDAYARNGGFLGLFVGLFFGKGKIVKWMIWELIPFAVFFFYSPEYMEFTPQKRYMEQTATKIDLSIPLTSKKTVDEIKSGLKNSRVIPEEDRGVFTGNFEDISSTSKNNFSEDINLEKTKSFDVSSAVNITPEKTSKASSYTSEIPLKKMDPVVNRERDYFESISSRREEPLQEKRESSVTGGNYSANRKF